ncbi:MAG: quaternary ammonium compound efflux SMR transporter SugE [Eubacteriales bacterium]|nr:quaternary ammonium compound efflux SMR transporter SugE [Eubacteriales bacterium]MDD4390293.1 quaternary ammonium compound efflux SMR transporter SugE [Eubacteriales bacterium]
MHWIYLGLAGIFETIWAVAMAYSHGFTRLVPSVVTVIGMIISFVLLAQALKVLPLGTAYAIWTGIGAVGAVICGVLLLGEGVNATRFLFVFLIICGIIGLKVTSP